MAYDRTFRVFISSTFSDLKVERAALQEQVFPDVRAFCEERGARFQPIDLRWGVAEEAARDQRTIPICLEEVARCQAMTPRPNFVVLLGDRYGWRPLPFEIPATEFGHIVDRTSADAESALLTTWYLRDDNAVPPVYVLQPRDGGTDDRDWGAVEDRLRSILLAGIQELDLSVEARAKYEASATEQEVLHGVLASPDARQHVFCFLRAIRDLPSDPIARDFVDLDREGTVNADAAGRLQDLKDKLRAQLAGNVHEYEARWIGESGRRVRPWLHGSERERNGPISTDHVAQLCSDVRACLVDVIRDELERLEGLDPIAEESRRHQEFGADRRQRFIGRGDALGAIRDHIARGERRPLVVVGEPGSGKSALLAVASDEVRRRSPHAVVVARFIGATPGSFEPAALVSGLDAEIARSYGAERGEAPNGWTELVATFRGRLDLASAERPLVIVLDALDQLITNREATFHPWFPREPPPHVTVVASITPDAAGGQSPDEIPDEVLEKFRRVGAPLYFAGGQNVQSWDAIVADPPAVLELRELYTAEAEALLHVWLEEARRTLQTHQRREVLEKFGYAQSPLYLKLAFEEARLWRSYTPAEQTVLQSDVDELIERNLFARVAAKESHGQILVSHALGYLAASRYGLAEDEVLDLLSADREVMADFRERSPHSPHADRLPVVVWSRLSSELQPYLAWRDSEGALLLDFFHRQLRKGARRTYMANGAALVRHQTLANYFHRRADPAATGTWGATSSRPLREVSYHLLEGQRPQDVAALFADLAYLTARLRLERPLSERLYGYTTDDDAFRNERILVIDEVSRTCAVWPDGAPVTPLCGALRSLVERGFNLISTEGDWDSGKLLIMNAVKAASEAALAREDLVGCFADIIDRIAPYLRSYALFEGPRGDYTGWTLYNAVKQGFEEVSKRAGPDRADWVAEWEAFWADPEYPK